MFFFNDTATTEIYTLSLHDALPISRGSCLTATLTATRSCPMVSSRGQRGRNPGKHSVSGQGRTRVDRSEEHTSELQSRQYLVCRLLLEKKNTIPYLIPALHFHVPPT